MQHDRDPEAINAEIRPEIGYEYRDISVKGIVQFTVWFFAGTTIVIALTYVFFWGLIDLPLRPTTPPETIPAYPNPLLQCGQMVKWDISKVKRDEDEHLNSYGWVDQERGIARIPIDKAMEEVAARGLARPAVPAETPEATRL